MSGLIKELENWFKDRPSWLQDATRRLLKKGVLDDSDFNELTKICGNEAGVKFEDEVPMVIGFPEGVFTQEEHTHKVQIVSIANVVGVNALNPRKPLNFSEGMSIIYGQNGSGKSGYTRLLKQICGAKNPGQLYPNTFEDPPVGQSCTINYNLDGKDTELAWSIDHGVNDQLSAIEIYDSACGSVYVINKNQLAYEPALLRLFTLLTEAGDNVSKRLDGLARQLVSAKPLLPNDYISTKSGQWYRSIASSTTEEKILLNCTWNDEDNKLLEELRVRLKTPDPKVGAEAIRKNKTAVDKLLAGFSNWQSKYKAEAVAEYFSAKKNLSVKQLAATEYAKSIFENSPLTGIGEDAWNLLWEQARSYSKRSAYPEVEFPNTNDDAVCVLCQQPLVESAKKRFQDFEGFVKGELESAAKLAKSTLEAYESDLKKTPSEEIITSFVAASGVTDEISVKLATLRNKIVEESESLLKTDADTKFNADIDFEVLNELVTLSKDMEVTAKRLDEDAKQDKREVIKKEVNELEARKWVSQQREASLLEVALQGRKQKIIQAKALTNTTALTRKKTALSDELVSGEYINRFEGEVKRLGAGRIKVKLEKTPSDKGRVYFQVMLEGNHLNLPVERILSEGEFRIISLAAFLADVEGHADKSSFIFDDPISSLDQDYEENVCARLAKMAKERQVIVFTHRLSMLSLLEDASKKAENAFNVIGLRRQPWGAGEPVDTPIFAQKTTNALNSLLDRTVSAKKLFESNGWDVYEMHGKGIASQFRIVLEKLVEKDLLADVVSRFRREVHTKNKLDKVSKITADDCRLVDEYMTKYSKYEHSQPDELPVPPPDPDELKKDIEAVKEWLEGFNNR